MCVKRSLAFFLSLFFVSLLCNIGRIYFGRHFLIKGLLNQALNKPIPRTHSRCAYAASYQAITEFYRRRFRFTVLHLKKCYTALRFPTQVRLALAQIAQSYLIFPCKHLLLILTRSIKMFMRQPMLY